MAEATAVTTTKHGMLLPQLSKEMQVAPLQKGQVAIYKLIESDLDDPTHEDLNGKKLKRSPGYTLCGQEEIYDRIAGQEVIISTKKRNRKIKTAVGEINVSDKAEPVRFTSSKPAIAVKDNQPDVYGYMERSNKNASNPFRDKSKKAIFYRVDAQRKARENNAKSEFRLDAMNWVLKEATHQELIACAEKVKQLRPDVQIRTDYKNSEASTGHELLKRELFALAETDPYSIIKGSTKIDSVVKMQVQDAESFQIILFTDGKSIATSKQNTWWHNDENVTTICVVEHGKDKYEALLEFFRKDPKGEVHYKKMMEQLNRMLTPR
jgi:hypothetical protein